MIFLNDSGSLLWCLPVTLFGVILRGAVT